MDDKVSQLEEGHKKNDILISGLEGRKEEEYFDTLGAMMKVLRESVKLEVMNGRIDCVVINK
jgi:hypothetical protein